MKKDLKFCDFLIGFRKIETGNLFDEVYHHSLCEALEFVEFLMNNGFDDFYIQVDYNEEREKNYNNFVESLKEKK